MKWTAVLLCLTMLGGCAAGPDYERPALPTAEKYKEAGDWKPASPADHLPRGEWWEIYGDAQLNELMRAVVASNQTVRQVEARYRAARSLVQSARAAYFPTAGANLSATRSRGSTSRFRLDSNQGGSIGNTYNLSLDAAWEIDLWGRLRRVSDSAQANAAASAADLAAATLSAQAELAQAYFQLRVVDEERAYLNEEITSFQRSLSITQNQYAVGVAKRADVLQAQTQLQSTQAQALDLDITRARLEHAIAVLTGQHPSTFTLSKQQLQAAIPAIPPGLPSELLQRRPDIAAAERRVMAANAQIGATRAAWFPALNLSGTIGYQSSVFDNLVSAGNRVWAAGPSAALSLLDAGQRLAASRQARANFDVSVAAYRQITLEAFRDVEDNLSSMRILAEERAIQEAATQAAREAETLVLNQYKAGTVSYLNVVVAQNTALTNARNSLQLRGRHLSASIALIKALGGGWSTSVADSAP